jgi:hypothetical protein
VSTSYFVRQKPKRPLRYWSAAKDRYPKSTSFCHRVPVRPAPFRLVPGGAGLNWNADTLLAHMHGAAMRRALYIGRVVEIVTDEGSILVDLWEVPSGRLMLASFPLDERISQQPAAVGDQLELWTWLELPGGGVSLARYHGELRHRELTKVEREKLNQIVNERENGEERGSE